MQTGPKKAVSSKPGSFMAEKWKKMLNSRWFKAIVCLVIVAFCFTAYQVYHKTIFAKMLVSAVVPYQPSQLGMVNNAERWVFRDKANDYYYGEVEKHITKLCGISSRNKGLDEVVKIDEPGDTYQDDGHVRIPQGKGMFDHRI